MLLFAIRSSYDGIQYSSQNNLQNLLKVTGNATVPQSTQNVPTSLPQ